MLPERKTFQTNVIVYVGSQILMTKGPKALVQTPFNEPYNNILSGLDPRIALGFSWALAGDRACSYI